MKQRFYIFIAGLAVGFFTAQIARTLFIGLILLGLFAGVLWFVVSYGKWREKLESIFRKSS